MNDYDHSDQYYLGEKNPHQHREQSLHFTGLTESESVKFLDTVEECYAGPMNLKTLLRDVFEGSNMPEIDSKTTPQPDPYIRSSDGVGTENSGESTLVAETSERWKPPRQKIPSHQKVAAWSALRNNETFRNFLESPVCKAVLSDRTTKNKIRALYPYYLIDLAAAYETGGESGGCEILEEITRRLSTTSEFLKSSLHVGWCEIPIEFKDRIGNCLDEETIYSGYQRYWVQFVDKSDPNYVLEFIWHMHDGWGSDAGSVELSVRRIDRRVAHLL